MLGAVGEELAWLCFRLRLQCRLHVTKYVLQGRESSSRGLGTLYTVELFNVRSHYKDNTNTYNDNDHYYYYYYCMIQHPVKYIRILQL